MSGSVPTRALGRRVVREREAEARAYKSGVRPAAPANEPALLVVGLDRGRVQERDTAPNPHSLGRESEI